MHLKWKPRHWNFKNWNLLFQICAPNAVPGTPTLPFQTSFRHGPQRVPWSPGKNAVVSLDRRWQLSSFSTPRSFWRAVLAFAGQREDDRLVVLRIFFCLLPFEITNRTQIASVTLYSSIWDFYLVWDTRKKQIWHCNIVYYEISTCY